MKAFAREKHLFGRGVLEIYRVGHLGADRIERGRMEDKRQMVGVVIGAGCHCGAREFVKLMTMVKMRRGMNSRYIVIDIE